jgi:tetratricopeptide (TPR) repeat protein
VLALLASVAHVHADPLRDDLTRGIAFLEKRIAGDPDDFIAANQLTERLTRRAAWTGSLDDLRRAEAVAAQSLRVIPAEQNVGGLSFSGRICISMHRFPEAKRISEQLRALQPAKTGWLFLRGDACVELGELDEAEKAFAEAIERDGASVATEWRLGRLAMLRGKREEAAEHIEGALNLARDLPDSAVDTLVWCLVQSGEFAFKCGDWNAAEKHYAEARKLAPDQWTVLDHLAELRAAQVKDSEAVELFTAATKAADRPEIWQALGDCHAFFKRTEEAKAAHKRALAGYLASIEKGEVLYIHHLAGFYSDSQENAAEAVKWARKDLELRNTGAARDALAWALYKAKEIPAALEESKRALQTGLSDAHVLYHAAMIHISASEVVEGQRLLRKCAEVNPHFNSFHTHR